MKKLFLFVGIILIFNSIFAQEVKIREFASCPYSCRIVNHRFTVLDIDFDNKLLAFKHVYRLPIVYDEMGEVYLEPCDCNYAGLDQIPYEGVVLGVYDLSKQEYLKTFTVYQAAHDTADCTKYDVSQKMLDSAKLFFKVHNLDIDGKPSDEYLNVEGDSINTFFYKDLEFSYINRPSMENEYFEMTTFSDLYVRSKDNLSSPKLIYSIYQQDNYYMAGGGNITYTIAYQENENFVFLIKFKHYSHYAGDADSEIYHFSPVYKLSDFK